MKRRARGPLRTFLLGDAPRIEPGIWSEPLFAFLQASTRPWGDLSSAGAGDRLGTLAERRVRIDFPAREFRSGHSRWSRTLLNTAAVFLRRPRSMLFVQRSPHQLDASSNPRSVAIVGKPRTRPSPGRTIIRIRSLAIGFTGPDYLPVNPKLPGTRPQPTPAIPSLTELTGGQARRSSVLQGHFANSHDPRGAGPARGLGAALSRPAVIYGQAGFCRSSGEGTAARMAGPRGGGGKSRACAARGRHAVCGPNWHGHPQPDRRAVTTYSRT